MATVAAAEEALVERVEALSARVEALGDPEARAVAEDLAAAVVQLYGEGLERIFAALDPALTAELAQDGVVASLMLIHGLFPIPLADRVREGLDAVRPYLESHGGDVELLGLHDGVARLALRGSCDGCSASRSTLEEAIERALADSAPDLLGLEVEGVGDAPPSPRAAAAGSDGVDWVELPAVAGLQRGTMMAAGDGLVVANVAGTLLAYHDACADCGRPLSEGALLGGLVTCAGCARRYDLPRAGRSADGGGLQLRPVPLLRNGGPVRVARPR